MIISPLAGKPAEPEMLVDVPKLVTAYYTETPDPWRLGSGFRLAPPGIAVRPSRSPLMNGISLRR